MAGCNTRSCNSICQSPRKWCWIITSLIVEDERDVIQISFTKRKLWKWWKIVLDYVCSKHSNFHLFRSMKKFLSSKNFYYDYIKWAIQEWDSFLQSTKFVWNQDFQSDLSLPHMPQHAWKLHRKVIKWVKLISVSYCH